MAIDDTVEDCPNTKQDEVILVQGDRSRHARLELSAHQQETALTGRILANYRGESTLRREDKAAIIAMTHEVALSGDELKGMGILDQHGRRIRRPDNYGNTPIYLES